MSSQQIRLDQANQPQRIAQARDRRERALSFLRAHESQQEPLLSGLNPMTAVWSVWDRPTQHGAAQKLEWGIRTHHAVLADQQPDWDSCPACGADFSPKEDENAN